MTRRILVIDDEESVVDIIRLTLEADGFEVKTALTGASGVALAKQDKPDLIFLDIMMPELNGLEVCAQLKEDPQTSDIPIVIISVKTLKEDIQRGLEVGASAYITKPFDPLTLRDVITNLLGNRKDSRHD